MFSMLSMLQKEGNAAQESPFIANAVRTKHSAGERTSSTREKQHGMGDSTAQGERTNSTRATQHGKSDSSGKQERGRQALRSCDFGGRCSGNL